MDCLMTLGEQRLRSLRRSEVAEHSRYWFAAGSRCSRQAGDLYTSEGLQRNAGGIRTGIKSLSTAGADRC